MHSLQITIYKKKTYIVSLSYFVIYAMYRRFGRDWKNFEYWFLIFMFEIRLLCSENWITNTHLTSLVWFSFASTYQVID